MDNSGMGFDDQDVFESSATYQPKNSDYDTFSKRNDPQPLIHRFKLQLLNAYEEEVEEKDETGKIVKKKKVNR